MSQLYGLLGKLWVGVIKGQSQVDLAGEVQGVHGHSAERHDVGQRQ